MVRFATHDIPGAFSAFGVRGTRTTSNSSIIHANIDPTTGGFAAGSVHDSVTWPSCFGYIESVTAESRTGAAQANCVLMPFGSVGTYVTNASLSGTPGVAKQLAFYSASVNGSAVVQATGASISFGITPIVDESEGAIFRNDVQLENAVPEITITTTSLALLVTIGNAIAISGGSTVISLAQYLANTAGYDTGSTGVTITIPAGQIRTGTVDGRPNVHTLIISGIDAGSNSMSIATGVDLIS
jgi:hypothetical protein